MLYGHSAPKTSFCLLFKTPGIMKYQEKARLYHHLWVDPCKKCLKRITFIIINTTTKLHLFARIENPFYVTWFPRLIPFFNERIAELNKGNQNSFGCLATKCGLKISTIFFVIQEKYFELDLSIITKVAFWQICQK